MLPGVQHVICHKFMSDHTIHLLLLVATRPPVLPANISLKQAAELYGEEEAQYLARFTSREALSLRLQARSLLMSGIQEFGLHEPGMSKRSVHLLKTKDGRPYLPLPDTAVSFSYTDRALCLLGIREDQQGEQAAELSIGSDWEEKRTMHLPPASFLAADMARTAEEDDEGYASRILTQWCRTEAVLKAAGCGLRIHPHDIEWMAADNAMPGHAGIALVHAPKGKDLYTWQDVQLDNRHLCSVAAKGEYQSLNLDIRFVTETGWPFA